MSPTVATEALKQLLEPRGARAALAAAIGEEDYQVSRWLTYQGRPVAKAREYIEDEVGLSWRLWEVEQYEPTDVDAAVLAAERAKPGAVERLIEAHKAALAAAKAEKGAA